MLIDRTHTRWIVASTLIMLISTGYYLWYSVDSINGPKGGSWPGLTYGIIGSFFILVAGGIGLRKKLRTWRLGKAQTWMRAHIWLGLMSFPMILFHCGFDFGPRWALAWVMMWMFVIIMVSGIIGLALQHVLPSVLMTRVRKETVFEQIDYVSQQLRWEADWLVTGVCGAFEEEQYDHEVITVVKSAEEKRKAEYDAKVKAAKASGGVAPPKLVDSPQKYDDIPWRPMYGVRKKGDRKAGPDTKEGNEPLRDFYLNDVQPYLQGNINRDLDSEVKATAVFQRVRTLVPPDLHESLQDLENIVTESRQLRTQRNVHHWLHYWLLIHGPISWAMIVLSVIHAVVALYY